MARNINTDRYFDEVNKFNPYKVNMEANDIFVKGIAYVFMTCPVLNLTEINVQSDPFLAYMCNSSQENLDTIKHLTNYNFTDNLYGNLGSPSYRLIPLISNRSVSIETKDTVARTKEVGESFYGYKQVHPGSLVDSIVGDEFSIKYLETDQLLVVKMHKVWQDYIEKIRRGQFHPAKKALDDGFIDYMSSVYYILCDFDGETIKYWCRYTGVTPLNVPYSALGGDINNHDIPDITINYQYCYKEDMNPAILRDFNRLISYDSSITNLKWFKGRTSGDSKESDKKLINKDPIKIPTGKTNFFYDKTLAIAWNGNGLTPKIYTQKLGEKETLYSYKLKFK